MYNIVNAVCLTFMLVPYFSMVSLTTTNSYERGMLGNISEIFGTLGNIAVNTFFVRLLTTFTESSETIYTQQSFTLTMLVVCTVMVVAVLITVLFTKERLTDREGASPDHKEKENAVNPLAAVKSLLKNKYWLMLTFAMFIVFFVVIMFSVVAVYYTQYIFNDPEQFSWMSNSVSVAQFAVMFATPLLIKKFGKHAVYTAGMGVTCMGFLGFGLFASSVPVMAFFNVLKGTGMGMAGGMSLGLVADTITYGKWKTGIDAVGMGNAGISAAQKVGMGLGTAVMGWALKASGFDATLDLQGIPQPESVLTTIKVLYTWVPLILCGTVFLMMLFFYNIEKELENHPSEE